MTRPVSAETRAKISEALAGRKRGPLTDEWRAHLSAVRKGVPKSREHRAAISAARKGQRLPAHQRAAMIGNTRYHDATIKGECVYCFGAAQTHDHVVPRGHPGWDDPTNLVLACWKCNKSKRNRTPETWLDGGLYAS